MDDGAPADCTVEVSHISTLAASIAPQSTEWKKKTPLKTYSKKSVSPSSTAVSPPNSALDSEGEGKSRYGRTRKLRPSGDFLSTDRKVSLYLKVHYEDQVVNEVANVRSMYSNFKKIPRPTHKEFGGPRSSLPARLPSNLAAALKNGSDSSEVIQSPLDIAAPTCTETLEPPLPLQDFESEDTDSEASSNSEYRIGDLVWAAIPGYPYWPAMITRDPITNAPYKLHGGRRKHWHVYFFGDRGFRGWVYSQNLFPFDLDVYSKKKEEVMAVSETELTKAEKKAFKQQMKLFTITERYQSSWNSAVSESLSLMESPWDERLEYFEKTYLTRTESKVRSWSSDMSLVNNVSKKATTISSFTAKPPVTPVKELKNMKRSWSSTLSLDTDEKKPKRRKSEVPSLPSILNSVETKVNGADTSPFKFPAPKKSKSPSKALVMSRSKVVVRSIPAKQRSASNLPVAALVSQDSSPLKTSTMLIAPINSPEKIRAAPKKPRVSKKSLILQDAMDPDALNIKSEPEDVPTPPSVQQERSESSPSESLPEKRKRGRPRKYPPSGASSPLVSPTLSPAPFRDDSSDWKIQLSLKNVSPKSVSRPRKYSLPEASTPLTKLFPMLQPATCPPPPASPRQTKKKDKMPLPKSASKPVESTDPLQNKKDVEKSPRKPTKASLESGHVSNTAIDTSAVSVQAHGVLNVKSEPSPETPKPTPPPTVTRSGRKSVKPEVLKPTFKTEKKVAPSKADSPPPIVIKQEISSPEGPHNAKKILTDNSTAEKKAKKNKSSNADCPPSESEPSTGKPSSKVEIAPKVQPKKSCALFAGVKDIKLCYICFKGGKVVRCRGPCSLFMHVECGDKPRFVPGADHRESDSNPRRRSGKKLGGPGRGKRKDVIKSETDDNVSLNGSIKEEVPSSDLDASVSQASETEVRLSPENGCESIESVPLKNIETECALSEDGMLNGSLNVDGECIKPESPSNDSSCPEPPSTSLSPQLSNGPVSPKNDDAPPSSAGGTNGSTSPGLTDVPSSPVRAPGPSSPQLTSGPELPDQTADLSVIESSSTVQTPEPLSTEETQEKMAALTDMKSEEVPDDKITASCNGDVKPSLLLEDQNSSSDSSSTSHVPPSDEISNPSVPEGESSVNGDLDVEEKMEVDVVTTKNAEGDIRSDDVTDKASEVDDQLNSERLDATESTSSDSSKKDAKEKGWMCSLCVQNLLGPCFACGKDDGERVRCKLGLCGKVFHLECLKEWPQHSLKQNAKGKVVFNCPAHSCHTCISDNPSCLTSRYLNDKLVRCMKCPTTYHHGNHCLPAGTEILSSTQIICPRHFRLGRKSLSHLNASWCFLCSVGGSLICCDLCPTAFHVECLNIPHPEGDFICEDCETGRFPLFGEIVWVKLGQYRWWPARILFPQEIPPRLLKVEHVPGEFAVRFYGTYDYYWVNRGRVFLFHDGDGAKPEPNPLNFSKKAMDEAFHKGVREANEDFILWNEKRNDLEESHRPTMKPPKYSKITSNKPVGSVKMAASDASSLTACDCSPDSKDPCGPDSDCINRLLLVECDPETCPAKDKCRNRNFEKRLYPPLAPFRTESRGWGLKTLTPLKKGDFIIEYVGEMIDEEEYKRRLREMQKNKDQNFYFLTLDKDRMLDAGPKGNLSRFMNHSCQPNCETQKWTVEGNTRVGLFALRDIPAEAELVFNYNLTTTGDNKIECRCGAPNCAGYIGGKPTKPQTKPKDDTKNKNGRPNKIKKRRTKKISKNLAKMALKNATSNSSVSKPVTPNCAMCNEGGATISCQEKNCNKMYHLSCTHLTNEPKQYTCPSHNCSTCSSQKQVENCSSCINSYCNEHQEGNMVINREKGPLCRNCYESDSGSEWSTGGKDDETVELPSTPKETQD